MKKVKYLSLAVSSMLLFTACGGGSGSGTTNSSSKTRSISGFVVDGPINGAEVCIDLICTKTDENGQYTLNIPLDTKKGTIIAKGGIDTVSGEELKGELKTTLALSDTPNITPATTFVTELVNNGNNIEQAKAEVKEYLNLGDKDIAAVDKESQKKLTAFHKAMGEDENLNVYEEFAKKDKQERTQKIKKEIEEAEKEIAKFFQSSVYPTKLGNVYFDANNNGKKDDGEIEESLENNIFSIDNFKDTNPTSQAHGYFVFRTDDGLAVTFSSKQKEQFLKNGIYITPITTFVAETANRLASKNDIAGVNMKNFMQKISIALGLNIQELYLNANATPKVKDVCDKIIQGLKEKNASYSDLVKALESNSENIDDLIANLETKIQKLQFTRSSLDVQINTSGNREDGKTYVISVSSKTKDEYKFFKDEDLSKINKLRIKSGNEKELFKFSEFYQEEKDKDTLESTGKSVKYLDIKLDVSKQEQLKIDDTYTLVIETLDKDNKVNGEITLNIKVVLAKVVAKDVEVDISKAFPDSSYGARKLQSGESILFNLEKDASDYFPERLDVIEKSAADLENIVFSMEENDSYKLVRIKDGYNGNKYVIVLKNGKTPKENEVLNLSAKVLYKDGDETKENTSKFKITIKNPNKFTFEKLKEKTKNSEAKEREVINENTSVEAIPEPENPVLKSFTDEKKYYPTNDKVIIDKANLILNDGNGEGSLTLKIVSGNEFEYFTEIEKNWNGDFDIKFNKNKDVPVGTYILGVKAVKGDLESKPVDITFTINEVKAPTVVSELTISISEGAGTKGEKVSLVKEDKSDLKRAEFILANNESYSYDGKEIVIVKQDENNNSLNNGTDFQKHKYELVGISANYEIKECYVGWSKRDLAYCILKKDSGSLVAEDIQIKVIAPHKNKNLESEQVTVRIID